MKESRYQANKRYLQANYENLTLSLPKGVRAEWKRFASARGLSLCEFIRLAVRHYCCCSLIYERNDKND